MDIDEDEDDARPQDLLLLDFSPHSARRRIDTRSTKDTKAAEDTMPDEVEEVEEAIDAVSDSQWSDFDSDTDFPHEPLEVDVIDEQSCIEKAACWENDVWTGLPYVRIRREMGVVANGVMIDDQRVMMVTVSGHFCACTVIPRDSADHSDSRLTG